MVAALKKALNNQLIKMNKLFFSIGVFLLTMSIQAQKTIKDGNAELRDAKNFHSISISDAFDVYLTQDNEEAVAVSANETKYRDLITVEVKNGVLHVGVKKEGLRWMRGNKQLKAYISFRKLDKLDVRGASDIYIQGTMKAEDLKLHISGASNLKGRIESSNLVVDLSGASDITVTGHASKLDLDVSGASKFKGNNFSTDFCSAKATGASDIVLTVNKEISANASGASAVKFKGEGVIREIRTGGASKVTKI